MPQLFKVCFCRDLFNEPSVFYFGVLAYLMCCACGRIGNTWCTCVSGVWSSCDWRMGDTRLRRCQLPARAGQHEVTSPNSRCFFCLEIHHKKQTKGYIANNTNKNKQQQTQTQTQHTQINNNEQQSKTTTTHNTNKQTKSHLSVWRYTIVIPLLVGLCMMFFTPYMSIFSRRSSCCTSVGYRSLVCTGTYVLPPNPDSGVYCRTQFCRRSGAAAPRGDDREKKISPTIGNGLQRSDTGT